ncbi:hypothetical protein QBC34DRAFT_431759 [Podospora aff. communis PSN243]|uniref:Cell wall mannoprotein PIR1-like C-terminal domain-containing protein n=1 Tax=Podospora aff. communis PSN243 TaxID=3040156 RepID=A0AAV9G1D9_9PEZI|nr:hypothetical protein QBC34DRAFT_431759 [Podospora aff. communis PSN243]
MRPYFIFLSGLAVLASPVSADKGQSGCCKFTLHASAPFDCPAGQLEDGQIRLNGSYPTSSFCIDNKGAITDANGFGCIVTGPPETQFQCDHGKAPETGFAISNNNTLTYHGSPKFFACPATDTEYNIYAPAQPVTITSTMFETSWDTETETETEYVSIECPTSRPSYIPTTKHCSRCSAKPTSKMVTTTSPPGNGTGGCTKACGGGHWNTTLASTIKSKPTSGDYGAPLPDPTGGQES